ncbi:MAG TPA: serine/threonine-protein kinase [Verrucomicrobiae bacterium]|nr:serine/threonine-protein kinase [Verrucomicrobiae bacterium]
MSGSARWSELQRLYHAALERPAEERASFIEQASAHDEGLRRDLQSLLAHDQADDDFLDEPAIGVAARELTGETGPPSMERGSLIGCYKILEQIARGGMGVVYRAEQQYPVRRTVALKVIRPGMDSAHVIARFQAERQALALMDHPNIARALDAGATSQGRLYFVMEMVDGIPVSEYCQKHELGLHQRLELFISVCQAIQHAHQKGVIHRDIKPSNILVTVYDGKPVPKVIDFGIAKAMHQPLTERSLHTQVGTAIGTFEYMSPEQAGSFGDDIDTRSDVYALGAVLYELIAGSTPLDRASLRNGGELEIMRRIREEDPPPPSVRQTDPKLSRAVRGDLDWVVMKALEKDRARRYETVNALGLDLRRFLEGEPVEAAPPSHWYRMGKFARRHRMGLLTAAAFGLLLLAGVVVITWMAMRAIRAEQAATAVNNFLQNDLLEQASPENQTSRPDPDLKVRAALDRAAARIEGRFDRQPAVEAGIQNTIGRTYLSLGVYPEGRKHLERALDLERRVLGAANPKTLKTGWLLGWTALVQGRYAEAGALIDQTLQVQRRVLGPEHPDTLTSMNTLAGVYSAQGKFADEEAIERKLLEIRRRVLGPQHRDTLASIFMLAVSCRRQGKLAEAQALFQQSLEIQRRVMGPEDPGTTITMNSLAIVYQVQDDFPRAEALFQQTLEIQRRVLGSEHPNTVVTMGNLAEIYYAEGRYAQAETLQIQAVEVERRVLGPQHPNTLVFSNDLALSYAAQGKYPAAEALFNQTLETQRRVLPPGHSRTLQTLSNLAELYQMEGKYALAQADAEQVLAGRRKSLGLEHPETMNAAAGLALAYQAQGKFAESEPLAREAFETDRRKRPDDWQRFLAESLLGASLAGQKKYADAEPLLLEGYQGMIARKARMEVPDWRYLDRARESIAELDRALGKPVKLPD